MMGGFLSPSDCPNHAADLVCPDCTPSKQDISPDYIMIPREVWDHHFAEAMKDFPDRYNSRAKLMLALEEHSHGGKNISSKKS